MKTIYVAGVDGTFDHNNTFRNPDITCIIKENLDRRDISRLERATHIPRIVNWLNPMDYTFELRLCHSWIGTSYVSRLERKIHLYGMDIPINDYVYTQEDADKYYVQQRRNKL